MLLHAPTRMMSFICYKVMYTCIIDHTQNFTGNISQILRIDCNFQKHFPMSNLHCSQATRFTLVHHRNCNEVVRKIKRRRDAVGGNCLYVLTSCMNQTHSSVSRLLVMYVMHKHEGMYNTKGVHWEVSNGAIATVVSFQSVPRIDSKHCNYLSNATIV